MKLTDIVRQVLEVASPLPSVSALESQFEFANIRYDQVKGLGAVPNNSNVHYKGFTIVMTAEHFLNLVPKRVYPVDDLEQVMEMEYPIASPFLNVSFDNGKAQVYGHEGRDELLLSQSYMVRTLHC